MQSSATRAISKSGGRVAGDIDCSRTQPFTAEITEVEAEDADYAGVFMVGDEVYNVRGGYNGTNDEGDIFIFQIPLEEFQPTVSPVEFYGMMWSGPMAKMPTRAVGFLTAKRVTVHPLESLSSSTFPNPSLPTRAAARLI